MKMLADLCVAGCRRANDVQKYFLSHDEEALDMDWVFYSELLLTQLSQIILFDGSFQSFAAVAVVSRVALYQHSTRCFIKKQPLLYFVISLHPKGRTV